MSKTKVKNGDVTLPITRMGNGPKLIFFNGAGVTRIAWKKVIGELKGRYDSITFDFRGHGEASPSRDYSFDAFSSDARAVLDAVGSDRPILVAWSMGADLAVSYAAAHPGRIAGLVIVDGAVPIPEGLVADPVAMRRSLNTPSMKISMLLMRLTPYRYRLSGDDMANLTEQVDAFRQHRLLELYRQVDCPIAMVLATRTSRGTGPNAERSNHLWREGAARLAAEFSTISIQWLDGSHLLPFERPADIAKTIDQFAGRVRADS